MPEEFSEARLKEERRAEIMHWAQEDAISLSDDRISEQVLEALGEINLDGETFGPITEEEMLETGLLMRGITAEDEVKLYSLMFNFALKTKSPLPGKSAKSLIN